MTLIAARDDWEFFRRSMGVDWSCPIVSNAVLKRASHEVLVLANICSTSLHYFVAPLTSSLDRISESLFGAEIKSVNV
jgi:hypothetical protein